MTPTESAESAAQVRAIFAALTPQQHDRTDELREAFAALRRAGVADPDAQWLVAHWARKLDQLAEALAGAVRASYGVTRAAKEIAQRIERNGNGESHAEKQ